MVFGAVFAKRFLLFHEKVKTTKVYLRDATLVGAYPLLLFGEDQGGARVAAKRQRAAGLPLSRRRAWRCCLRICGNLAATLMRKVADPSLRGDADAAALVRTIVELLESEETNEAAADVQPGTGNARPA